MSEPTTEVEAVALNLKARLSLFDRYAGFGKTQHYGPQQAETDRRVLKILAAMSPALEEARAEVERLKSTRDDMLDRIEELEGEAETVSARTGLLLTSERLLVYLGT